MKSMQDEHELELRASGDSNQQYEDQLKEWELRANDWDNKQKALKAEQDRLNQLLKNKEDEYERLKAQLLATQKELDDLRNKLREQDQASGSKFTEYESKIAELRQQNQQLN